MEPIYVTGHRNPDTDSIVAAIAYAALRNALGDWEYVPACLGHISDETMRVLNRFGYEPPMRLFNVYTQVRDLDYEKPQTLFRTVTVGKAITPGLIDILYLGVKLGIYPSLIFIGIFYHPLLNLILLY